MTVLAVVVPATDAPPTLGRCLDAIGASHEPPEEVVVVDRPASLSAAEARNVGAARTSADVVVFVDADVAVHPDALGRVRVAFATAPDIDAVYGSYDDSPAHPATVSVFRNLLHHHVHHENAGPAETFWTGLGAVRRASFLAVGGFDHRRYPHPSIEDIAFGDQLAATGAHIVLDPAIQGTHLKAWTLRSMLWTDFARRGVPWVALQVRSRRVSDALNCGWRHRVSALAWVVVLVSTALGIVGSAFGALGALLLLNQRFYLLLARRMGVLRAGVGVGLHGLHHLVSIAAVPAGIAVATLAPARPGSGRADGGVGDAATTVGPAPAPPSGVVPVETAAIEARTGPDDTPDDAGRTPSGDGATAR